MSASSVAAFAAALTCLGAVAPAGTPPTPTPARVTVTTPPADPDTLTDTGRAGTRAAAATPAADPAATAKAGCVAGATPPIRDGEPIVVTVAPAKPFTIGAMTPLFDHPPVSEPAWQLWFYAFRWIQPLVGRAVADGQTQARDALVGQVVDFYRVHPDRGVSKLGWDEGSSLRRLETLNCLYSLTRDARLPAAMATEVNLQFGPRYYGPPRHPIHNHGLMANLDIVMAGRLIGRTDWVDRASARMRAEVGGAFTAQGVTHEESSTYQMVNTSLWNRAADNLALVSPYDPTVPLIRLAVARAQAVGRWLTEPDGRLVQIGDAHQDVGIPTPVGTPAGVFRDDAAGLVVGRTGWDATADMYTLRYGPRTWAHGHPDTSTLTWTSRGQRVLVGSGYVGNEPSDPLVVWQKTPQAANAAIPLRGKRNPNATGTVRGGALRAGTRTWVLGDRSFGVPHTRTVAVTDAGHRLAVADAFPRRTAADQMWHLDPSWMLVSARGGARAATFRNASGRVLRITTTGSLASARRGAKSPVAGWNFPQWAQPVPAWELRIRSTTGATSTVFTTS